MPLVSIKSTVPLYDANGEMLGHIQVSEAKRLESVGDLTLREKGTGRRCRYTSAKLHPRVKLDWIRIPSGGFTVLQLVNKADLKNHRRRSR
jgi:hypothetical protein